MKYRVLYIKKPADTITPVGVYLRMRDKFQQVKLLESSDYNSNRNSFTFIVANPLHTFKVNRQKIYCDEQIFEVKSRNSVKQKLKEFIYSFQIEQTSLTRQFNGLYGFSSFEAVQYFDTLNFSEKPQIDQIPDMQYDFYEYIVAINHFNDEVILMQNIPEGQSENLSALESVVFASYVPQYQFQITGEETSFITDDEFLELVKKGKEYARLGEIFQIVFSRRFVRSYQGDDFNVYRSLRSINPSPYLFYFDYGSYKIFGSSPESQLVISERKAKLNPIAGTYKKTGNDFDDALLAEQLGKDPKENAEHTMLVDLARNDLNRFCTDVKVEKYKEIQHFSHVLHIVSEVTGKVNDTQQAIDIFGATFPAGTLSGAPKFRALELIHQDEKHLRSFYGGTVGIISLTGDINTAITIRSFLAYNGNLHYQAGAGVVVDSVPEKELKEVDNKLGALRKAIDEAIQHF